jgi:AcrR family transcriptional regulator
MIDKKDHILNAAEELFAEHGYEGTSTRMLAQKAGVNVAMISYYFGSKEKLFEAFVENRARHMREMLQMVHEKDIDYIEKIDLMAELYVERVFSNSRFHRCIHRELSLQQRPELNEMITNVLIRNSEEFARIIRAGQKKKVFRSDIDISLVIVTLTGTITYAAADSLMLQKVLGLSGNVPTREELKKKVKKHLKDLLVSFLVKHKSQ